MKDKHIREEIDSLKAELEDLKNRESQTPNGSGLSKRKLRESLVGFVGLLTVGILVFTTGPWIAKAVDDLASSAITAFSAGDVIDADEMNTNFENIRSKINEINANTGTLHFPDGIGGDAILEKITDIDTYTVTSGKNLYITSFASIEESNYELLVEDDDNSSNFNKIIAVGGQAQAFVDWGDSITNGSHHITFSLPIIVGSGKTIKTNTSDALWVLGFEISASVTPVNARIDTSGTSLDSDLVLFRAYNSFATASSSIMTSGTEEQKIIGIDSLSFVELEDPIIIRNDNGIKSEADTGTFYINGYYMR